MKTTTNTGAAAKTVYMNGCHYGSACAACGLLAFFPEGCGCIKCGHGSERVVGPVRK